MADSWNLTLTGMTQASRSRARADHPACCPMEAFSADDPLRWAHGFYFGGKRAGETATSASMSAATTKRVSNRVLDVASYALFRDLISQVLLGNEL